MNIVRPDSELSEKEKFSHFLMEQCLSIRRWALTVALLLYIVFAVMDVIKFPSEIYSITLTTRIFLVILPFSPITIPMIAKLAQKYEVDIFPDWFKDTIEK